MAGVTPVSTLEICRIFPSYTSLFQRREQRTVFSFYAEKHNIHRVSGFDYYAKIGTQGNGDFSIKVDGNKYKFSLDPKTVNFVVRRNEIEFGTLDLMPLFMNLKRREVSPTSHLDVPQEEMSLEGQMRNVGVNILFSEIHMHERKAKIELTSANADVLVKIGE